MRTNEAQIVANNSKKITEPAEIKTGEGKQKAIEAASAKLEKDFVKEP